MIFSSFQFIFIFMPILLAVYYVATKLDTKGRTVDLVLITGSLVFYGWWNPIYLPLILGSIAVNYAIANFITAEPKGKRSRTLMIAGVSFNLALLGYFKYADWLVGAYHDVAGITHEPLGIVLPLAISFFTFQQIAYLVDAHKGEQVRSDPLTYSLFVLFFPQLIAGPIVHYKEMMPQFERRAGRGITSENVTVGLTMFSIGLFKKLVFADGMSGYAVPVFAAADSGVDVTLIDAWIGALAYAFQLYFDFSGYSDMAIGLARLFGIRLPLNFNSPYKSGSHTEFWRRWHLTLSRFLRDYIYIPLGGSRHGEGRRLFNQFMTMFLGGLWHGAGWTFFFWGIWMGGFMVVEAIWEKIKKRIGIKRVLGPWGSRIVFWIVFTFHWPLFRAETLDGSINMYRGMLGLNGITTAGPWANILDGLGISYVLDRPIVLDFEVVYYLIALHIWVWVLPNAQQIMGRYRPAFETYPGEVAPLKYKWMAWRPSIIWGLGMAAATFLALAHLNRVQEFLYFQF